MRKRDGFRKIEIVGTDSENSNASICNINKYTNFFLILIIILLYLVIVFLLIKAFFIYADMKDQSSIIQKRKYNYTTKQKYTNKINIINNISKTEKKSNYVETAKTNNKTYTYNYSYTYTNTSTNSTGANINATKTEIIFTPSLLNNFTEEISPKISIIVLIEEKENLVRLLYGIQKQKFVDFELLIIDDNIINDRYSLYDSIKSRDKRVKLIDYKNKVGNLKKRIDAINKSKGEYVIFIDSDDYFTSKEDSFQVIYDKVVKDNIDILEFKSYHYISNDYSIIYQPKLFDLMYFSTDNYCDIKQFHLSGKLINKNLLIEAFKIIDDYYLQKGMNYFDQSLILLILFKKAKSFLFYNFLQTAKLCQNNDIYFNEFNQHNKRDFLLYLKFLIQNTDYNVPEKRLVSSLFINFIIRRGIKFVEKEELELLNQNIKLLLDCIKISDNDHYLIQLYQKETSNNSQQ